MDVKANRGFSQDMETLGECMSTSAAATAPEAHGQVSWTLSCGSLFNFSAQRFTTEDLSRAAHSSELELFPRPFVSLNVDPYLMGVGGDDIASASVQEDFLLPPDVYKFSLEFSPHYL